DDDEISRNLLDQTNPFSNAPARQADFIDREVEVSGFGPFARRTLFVAVDKSDVYSAPFCFARKAYRDGCLADAAFALRDDNSCSRAARVALSNFRVSAVRWIAQRRIRDCLISSFHREKGFYHKPSAEKVNRASHRVHHRPAMEIGDR